jgi:hypothetical protein
VRGQAHLPAGLALLCVVAAVAGAGAVEPAAAPGASAPGAGAPVVHRELRRYSGQSESDAYTRYDLLAPESASFHIAYEVTATTAGATAYFNPIRRGSDASGEAVFDRASGQPLRFEAVSGEEARRTGLPDASLDMHYLRIHLPRPVPAEPPGAGVRLLIDKTYRDPLSYFRKGDDRIVFRRVLGVLRNAVVLPAGYEVVACNVAVQVLSEPDGRTKLSFMNTGLGDTSLAIEARRLASAPLAPAASSEAPAAAATPRGAAPPEPAAASASVSTAPSASASVAPSPPAPAAGHEERRLVERARQDRSIVYLLRQPETHAFDLYHDYTESREGTDKYLNVVRPGSEASSPSARNLDTGEPLRVETLRGAALLQAGLTAAELEEVAGEGRPAASAGGVATTGGAISPGTEVVIARFPALRKGESLRLRIAETYTDPASYRLAGDRLIFDRTFGRPRNAVVLPDGWILTATAIPATISETPEGRIRLDFVNPRPDEIAVLIEARRR